MATAPCGSVPGEQHVHVLPVQGSVGQDDPPDPGGRIYQAGARPLQPERLAY
jgi:hypothetical protein